MDQYFIIGKHVEIVKPKYIGPYVCIGVDKEDIDTTIGKNAVIRSHTIIYGGNRIGEDFQTGHSVLVRENNTIGRKVSIGSHSIIEHNVIIGNNVRIHSNSFIPEYSILGDGCWIGPGVVFTNARYPQSIDAKKTLKGPHIGEKARIGANVTILPGVSIGKEALIGAGSVVVYNVLERTVVAGNPARIINTIDHLPYV